MKTLILKSKLALVILALIACASCSSDDVVAPTVSYASNTIDAVFFEYGSSLEPTIDWNGNQGSFSLETPIEGLTINAQTGVLNWTKKLPVGTHNVQVMVSNSAGETTVDIALNNPIEGVFTGVYSGSHFFEIEFNSNGTTSIRANDETNPTTATGTWTINGENINIDYTYDIGGEFSLSGTFAYGSTVIYSGNWFVGHGAISGTDGGSFEVVFTKTYL